MDGYATTSERAKRLVWRKGGMGLTEGVRLIPGEMPVALVYDSSTYAVVTATPADLEDFAVGFSLSEAIVARRSEIKHLEIIRQDNGIEARMWLAPEASLRESSRRRQMAGPAGCGLCGAESLQLAGRLPPRVASAFTVRAEAVPEAMASLVPIRKLNAVTRAVHAAAFWRPDIGTVAVREDIRQESALDKLAGHLAREGISATNGMLLLSGRVPVEMVQKAARLGTSVIAAAGAPAALAVRLAADTGITLVAMVSANGFEIFSHPQRVKEGRAGCAARGSSGTSYIGGHRSPAAVTSRS